jgi:NAD+ synthase
LRLTSKALTLNWETVKKQVISFICNVVEKAKVDGVVLGLSGGLDSAVTAALCVEALGRDRVMLLLLPDEEVTPTKDSEDAQNLARRLNARFRMIEINPIYTAYTNINPIHDEEEKIACGNLRARIRMNLLYYYGNARNLLVVGTGDKSEILIGYFTKWGDGASDLRPIGNLYKTQVRSLAVHLGLPEEIVSKPSSPGLLKGQLAEKEIGMKYNLLDLILLGVVDLKMKREKIARELNIPVTFVDKVRSMVKKSKHKRKSIPSAPIR